MTSSSTLPLWRSILFVPVNVDRFVDKAHVRGADAVLLDLEDSIAASEKEAARRMLAEAVAKVRRGPVDIGVRINRPLEMAVRDIEAAVIPGVSFLSLTKLEGALHVRLLSELISELERARGLAAGSVRLIANVETASGFWRLEEIARSDTRVVGLVLGSEDFALSCGFEPGAEVLFLPKQLTVFAARSAGILPLGLVESVANFADLDRFRQVARRSSALGFTGSYAIHPAQVAILNEEFSPSVDAIAKAEAMLAATGEAMRGGVGAFAYEGKMIDKPIIERAERLVERAAKIAARRPADARED